jgi:hypothetical protein
MMPVVKGDGPWQAFNPRDGIPPIPEDMVAFYESYIPVALEDRPQDIPAAKAALARRDVLGLERILNPLPKPQS